MYGSAGTEPSKLCSIFEFFVPVEALGYTHLLMRNSYLINYSVMF